MIELPPQETNFSCMARLRQTHEQGLIARMWQGEDVRDEVVLYLQPALRRMAYRMYQRHFFYSYEERAIEPDDLVQSANVRVLEKFSRACTQEKPLAWLCSIAMNAMRDCLNGRSDTIKHEPGRQAIPLLKLSALFSNDRDGAPVSLEELLPYEVRLSASTSRASLLDAIKQAVEALPEKQRVVITKHFGLDTHAPVPLRQISRELSPNTVRPCSADWHYRRALGTLRETLSHAFPQYTTAGGTR